MNKRYSRNIGVITQDEQVLISQKSVCIIGCGGLGGGAIENLTRLGVGKLTVVDSDVFDVTNLNRQVLSNEGNIGKAKAAEAVSQIVTAFAPASIATETAFARMEATKDTTVTSVTEIFA